MNGGAQGTITVSAKTLDPQEYIRRAAARGELPPVDDSYPVAPLVFKRTQGEVILQGSSANWFGFELSEPTLIGIRTLGSPSGVDTKLVLLMPRAAWCRKTTIQTTAAMRAFCRFCWLRAATSWR
ncbi:hypothetical protein QWZ10_09315 [Paracoccus cavernae]|uniref:Uncharacterized protein n=1 Tax=Paracoccus cavernae TaxID=1571207 RepID=A0ABT8D599_9RHOB|nr:hypothetical protein [Paracoccus cavernae]